MNRLAAVWAVVGGMLMASPAWAADWPQFRGPGGRGVAEETGLPTHWTATDNVRWKADLPGPGASSPVVVGGRVYLTACSGPRQDRLHVLCFDAAAGRKLWERRLWATGGTMCHPKTNMAAATPVADGERVTAFFATGDLVCFSRDGDLLWYRALARDYPTLSNQVGLAASPVPWQDLLLLSVEHRGRESYLLGIDRRTGKNRWRTERPHEFNWVTPLVYSRGGRDEVLLLTPWVLTSYDPATGKENWALKGGGGFNIVAMPVVEGDLIFVPGGGTSLTALRLVAGKVAPERAWAAPKLSTNESSPLYYRGRIYTVNRSGVLACGDAATGKVLWQERLAGGFSASPVGAAGHVYVVNEDGATTVVQAGDEAKILSRNILDEPSLATPAIADGAVFLRTDKRVYCFAEKGK